VNDENIPRDMSNVESVVIPDGMTFVIVDVDRDNERVQIEFALNGKVMRVGCRCSCAGSRRPRFCRGCSSRA
jgi:hypothetical protein